MNSINKKEIQFSPTVRLFDPNGRVFFYKNAVYRGVYKHRTDFVKKLFSEGIIQNLMDKKLVVGTHLTNFELDDFGMVLQHDKIDVDIKPAEWSIVSYIEAAKKYLQLIKELKKNDLTLTDFHHGNFSLSFDGIPLWHDIGSIIEMPKNHYPKILAKFMEFYYNPIMYYQKVGSFPLIRRLGLQISNEDYNKMMLSFPQRIIEKYHTPLAATKVKNAFANYAFRILGKNGSRALDATTFSKIIDGFYSQLDQVKYQEEHTKWKNYHDEAKFEFQDNEYSPRKAVITDLLKQFKPDRVLDLGANQGLFSHLAHRYSPVVIASDYDHAAVAKHAKRLLGSQAQLRIYPVILDASTLSDNEKRRYKCHTVLALALTHHLRLGQGYPFDHIAVQFADLTEHCLITEFMPNGLGVGKVAPDPLPDDYTRENFLFSLRKFFRTADVVEYDRDPSVSTRDLILCKK